MKIFTINPGSTSTKVAMFEDENCVFSKNVSHDAEKLAEFDGISAQLPYRKETILSLLKEAGQTLENTDAFVGRGGGLLPLEGGTYEVSDILLDHAVRGANGVQHPAQLGPQLAKVFTEEYGGKAFVVNPPDVDELQELARMTGIKGVNRYVHLHALNLKETAIRHAQSMGKNMKIVTSLYAISEEEFRFQHISIPYVVSLITGIDQGICVTAIFCGFIGIQFLILLKRFRPVRLLQVIASTVFGYFVTMANQLTTGIPACTNYPMRLLYLMISMILVAIGVALYLKPRLISLPGEGVMGALVERFGIKFPNATTGFDTAMVIVATLLSILAFHRLNGVREGTIIAAISVGQLMKVWNKFGDPFLTDFLKVL